MIDILWKIVKVAIALIVFYIGFLWLLQRQVMYFPRPYPQGLVDTLPVKKVQYQVSGDDQVAYYLPSQSKQPACLWVMFGGNAALALGWLELAIQYDDPNVGFLLVDYPGYGENAGSPSKKANFEAVHQSIKALREMGVRSENVGVVGHSLGSAMAVEYAASYPVDNLVLLSPFTSMRDMVKTLFPGIGIGLKWLLWDDYLVESRLDEVLDTHPSMKVMIVHGSEDEIVPVEMSRQMQARYRRVEYIEINGAEHNFIGLETERIIGYLKRLCLG